MATTTTQPGESVNSSEPHSEHVAELHELTTESSNDASIGFDTKSALEIARIINHEDSKIAAAVRKSLPEIALVIDMVARSLRDGGRLIYVGAGSSGRIAALDSAECPPTFSTPPQSRCSTSWPADPRRWLGGRSQRGFARARPARHGPPPAHAQGCGHRTLFERTHSVRGRGGGICSRPRRQDRGRHLQSQHASCRRSGDLHRGRSWTRRLSPARPA